MSQQLDLKQVEQKVFRSAFDDGLWDLLIGVLVLMFALAPILSRIGLGDFWSSAVFVPVWGVAYVLLRAVRKRVVVPRIGIVKLGLPHRLKLMRFNIVMLAALSVALVLGFMSARDFAAPAWVHALRFSLTMLIVFGLAAYLLDFRRLYAYGLLLAASPPAGEWLFRHAGVPHHGLPVTFGVTAGVIIFVGLANFMRVLREPEMDADTLTQQETHNV